MKKEFWTLLKSPRSFRRLKQLHNDYEKGKWLQNSTLVIDTSTICSANCIFCAYQFDRREKKTGQYTDFSEILSEFRNLGGKHVSFTPLTGEALLAKDIIKLVEQAKGEGFEYITMVSNLSHLHTVGVNRLLKSGLDHLWVSTTEFKEDIYESIYRSKNYKRTYMNICELLKQAKETSSGMKITISYRSPRMGTRSYDYKVGVEPYKTEFVKEEWLEKYDSWAGQIKEEDLMEGMKLTRNKLGSHAVLPCSRIYSIHVDPTMTLRLCGCRINYDRPEELVIGKYKTYGDIEKALVSEEAKRLVQSFTSGNQRSCCQECGWYAS